MIYAMCYQMNIWRHKYCIPDKRLTWYYSWTFHTGNLSLSIARRHLLFIYYGILYSLTNSEL